MSWRHYDDDECGSEEQWSSEINRGGGDGREVPGPTKGPLADLSRLLGQHTSSDVPNFTFGGVAKSLPSAPGLYIEGVGIIPLPVNDAIGETIIKAAK